MENDVVQGMYFILCSIKRILLFMNVYLRIKVIQPIIK